MPINTTQYYLNIIKGLSNPGGEALLKSSLTTDKFRPLINIDIFQGQDYYYRGTLSGKVNNLFLRSNRNSLDSIIMDDQTGEGIWTTAIPSPVYKLVNNVIYYWLPLANTQEDTSYVIDIGYVDTDTGEIYIVDSSVPVLSGGIFSSRVNIPVGLKIVVLKKVSTFLLEPVLIHFGSYENPDSLLRLEVKTLCSYNKQDQAVNLEELAFCLIELIALYNTPINVVSDNKQVFRPEIYKSSLVADIINRNLSRLTRLIDTNLNSSRYGSIPSSLTTYLEHHHIYTTEADNARLLNSALHPSIEVSTRAVSWTLLAFSLYKLALNDNTYEETIDQLATYLTKFDKLPTEGWTHSNLYQDSQPILEYHLSTAVITFVALLKAFEAQGDVIYLEHSLKIQTNINSLFRTTNSYIHSSLNPSPTLEATIYGLLLNIVTGRADIIELLLNNLQSLTRYDFSLSQEKSLTFLQEGVLEEFDDLYVFTDDKAFVNNAEDLSFFFNNNSNTTNLSTTRFNNQLVISVLEALSKDFSIYFLPLAQIQQKIVYQEQLNNTHFAKALYAISALLDKPLFNYAELSFVNSSQALNTLKFYHKINFSKLKAFIPTDFHWFAPRALTNLGVLGQLLKATATALSNLFLSTNLSYKATALNTATLKDLDRWGLDLHLPRNGSELDQNYRQRLLSSLVKERLTSEAIIQNLASKYIHVQLKEPWQYILRTTNDNISFGSSLLKSSYYSGNTFATTNLVVIETNQPFNKEAMNELLSTVAPAVKTHINETIRFIS